MTVYKLQQKDGQYFTEPILSEEEWYQVLLAADKCQPRRQLEALQMFLCQPGHRSTCSRLGKVYSMSASGINLLVQHFGKYTKKVCGKEFRVEANENTDDTYWPITMLGRPVKGGHFEWELRPELASALQRLLREKLVEAYRGPIIAEGLDNSRSDELYKWRLIASLSGRSTEEIVRGIVSNECNFVEKPHAGATILSLLDRNPKEVFDTFEVLLQDKPLNERLQTFSSAARGITPAGKTSFGDERTAAAFLCCVDPKVYTPYTSTVYEAYCKYMGIPMKNAGQKYGHFLELLNDIIPLEQQDSELQDALHRDTDSLFWSDLINAQDVLWQMQKYMEEGQPKNWLQRIYDEALESKEWVFEGWYPEYKKSIELFSGMFDEGKTAEDVDRETKDYFIFVHENYISSNLQGKYSYSEYEGILPLWPQMYEIFKRNLKEGKISREDYDKMELLMQPALNKQHPAAYHRLWAGLFPKLLTTTITDSKFQSVYERVRAIDPDLPKPTGHWLEDNLTIMSYFGQKVSFVEPLHQGLFAWYLYENLNQDDNNDIMDTYKELLESNYNLVLTGAPGTGKTYLAKQIAASMIGVAPEQLESSGHFEMVQFHPSYDYTDFVEGLRPLEKKEGFERRDGVFKNFCRNAVEENDQDGGQSLSSLYEILVERIKSGEITFFEQRSGARIYIRGISNNNTIRLSAQEESQQLTENLEGNKQDYYLSYDYLQKLAKVFPDSTSLNSIKNLNTEIRQIVGGNASAYWAALSFLWKIRDEQRSKKGTKKIPYVFLIDEINRGELSKIFGELFFSIDPGYRGKAGRVKTQYQNLVMSNDLFYEGFYVPENVCIIGTMNDIDRGVESMDFAIRRRFAWVEVKAEDRVSMLDEMIPEWSEDAKRCMKSLNATLQSKEVGLTSAYDIGPSYFLKLEKYDGSFEKLWDYHIKGILTEYLRGTRGIEEKITVLKKAYDVYKETK